MIEINRKPNGFKELFGSVALTRNEPIKIVGGLSGIDNDNRFVRYQQLYTITPHTFMAIQKLGLSLVKNYRFEGKKNLVKNFENWGESIDFSNKLQTMARLALINGTYVALIIDKKTGIENDIQEIDFQPLLMSKVTLLPDNIEPGTTPSDIIMPPVTRVIVNEGDIVNEKIYRKDNCFIYSRCPRDKVQEDSLGRETYGIYGISLFDSIEEILYKYINLVDGYTNYIKKYGIGRYFIDYTLLAELVKDGQLELEDALDVMQELAYTNSEIKENEDIVGIGFGIKQLDSGGSNINVVDMKNSLETDIQVGLFQSPVTMGRSQGSTFASAYVSEDDRLLALEGIQKSIEAALNAPNGIIGKRLEMMGKKPGDIKIVFSELSTPKITEQGYYNALLVDAVTKDEFRKFMGLPKLMPKSENKPIKQNIATPTSNPSSLEPDNYPQYKSDEK